MSRTQQDQVIDDDENETCPLCIEEFDLSDRGFKPCPCGYQICQFCYNNIKTTMNGLCPACRRPYDDKDIVWQQPTVEEVARYKESRAQQAKKKDAARKTEVQKKEADSQSRKHLQGIRVRRQNLVYVTGLRLNTSDPKLSEILRGEQYFGQYGKIDKIVVNKPKDSKALQPVGVYITYFRKEDAALCIEMVNGTQNGGQTIRADYGTTKYCSAYLRGEVCQNRNCTFLHEAGDENESFSRQEMSSFNASSKQSAASYSNANMSSRNQPAVSPSQHMQHPAPDTSQAMERQDSRDSNNSPIDSSDGSALPSTASWANKNVPSRGPSQPASLSSPSPLITTAVPAQQSRESVKEEVTTSASETPAEELQETRSSEEVPFQAHEEHGQQLKSRPSFERALHRIKETLSSQEFKFVFDESTVNPKEMELIKNFPPLFDPDRGKRRQLLRREEAERRDAEKDQQVATQALSAIDVDTAAEGGSLQLGGEPEEGTAFESSRRRPVQPPLQEGLTSPAFDPNRAFSPTNPSTGANNRQLGPQQQQQILLQQLKGANPGYVNPGGPSHSAHSSAAGIGHARQASRYSFANDSASASASVKAVANQKLMSQQSSMMSAPQFHTHAPAQGGQFFSSGVQGPPPGLKATGTPPVSGGGMFGQGHGFATAGLNYNVNSAGRSANDEMMRELLRNRGGSAGSGPASDGRRLSNVYSPFRASSRNSFLSGSHDSSLAFGSSRFYNIPRRAVSSLPPGLAVPVSRAASAFSVFGLSSPIPEQTHLPGLGVSQTDIIPQKTEDETAQKPSKDGAQRPSLYAERLRPRDDNATLAAGKPEGAVPKITDDESFPSLPKPAAPSQSNVKPILTPVVAKGAPLRRKESAQNEPGGSRNETEAEAKATAVATKRQPPTRIDIPSATATVTASAPTEPPSFADALSRSETVRQQNTETSTTPSGNSQPATPGVPPPITRRVTQPKTIRVLPVPKPETTKEGSFTTREPQTGAANGQASRQASATSATVPSTPASERHSDTVSVVTDTVSRATSPAPRNEQSVAKSKGRAQQKKERQERAKATGEDKKATDSNVQAIVDEVVREPIVGRKKKTKKPEKSKSTTTTPAASRPPSPRPIAREDGGRDVPQNGTVDSATDHTATQFAIVDEASKAEPERLSNSAIAASIITGLHEAGKLDLQLAHFFNSSASMGYRHDIDASALVTIDNPPALTQSELNALNEGKPVRRGGADGRISSRMLITPSRKCLRGLSREMEDRYLVIESRVLAARFPYKYRHRRTPPNGSSNKVANSFLNIDDVLKDMAAVLTRPPTTTTASNKEQLAEEPKLSSTYANDALAYLDQFILPPLPQREHHETYGEGLEHTKRTGNQPLQARNDIADAIPRTYTTGDPTYSVSGFDSASVPTTGPAHAVARPPPEQADNSSSSKSKNANAKSKANGGQKPEQTSKDPTYITGIGPVSSLGGVGLTALGMNFHTPSTTQNFSNPAQAYNISAYNTANNSAYATSSMVNGIQNAAGIHPGGVWAGGLGPPMFGRIEDAERAAAAGKKEGEILEKRVRGLMRRNRRLIGLTVK